MSKGKSKLLAVPLLDGAQLVLSEFQAEGSDEYIVIENLGTIAQPLTNWVLASLRGETFYTLPDGLILHPQSRVRIHSGPAAQEKPPTDWVWTQEFIWNNKGDTAVLFDANGHEVARATHGQPRAPSRDAKLLYREDGEMYIEDRTPARLVNR